MAEHYHHYVNMDEGGGGSTTGDVNELLLPQPSSGLSLTPELTEVEGRAHSRWSHQKNLDRFFRRAYRYYRGGGAYNIILARCADAAGVLFVLLTLLFLTTCVDYGAVANRVSKAYTPCTLPAPSLFEPDCGQPAPMSFARLLHLHPAALAFLAGLGLTWTAFFLAFVYELPALFEMRAFYTKVLRIDNTYLQTVRWSTVLARLSEAQRVHEMCITQRELSWLEITNLIMRKENYLIALYNHDCLDVRLRLPGVRAEGFPFLPASLDRAIRRVITSFFFDRSNNVKARVKGSNPSDHEALSRSLRNSFRLLGLTSLLLAPVLIVYRIAVFSFQNSGDLRGYTGSLATRTWTRYARWRLREFCEVDHYFQQRLSRSYRAAKRFVGMFNSRPLAIAARSGTFLAGGAALVLVVLGVIFDEEFFFADLTPGRSVSWWLGVLGATLAVCRSAVPDENLIVSPAKQLRLVASQTHYMPSEWVRNEDSFRTYYGFSFLFQYQLFVALEEIVGVLITPYMLLVRLPKCADDIVAFFHNYTLHQEGIGDVCSFAVFSTDADAAARASKNVTTTASNIGPMDAAAAAAAAATTTTTSTIPPPPPPPLPLQHPFTAHDADAARQQSKVAHSIISFRDRHPKWEPPRPAADLLEHQEEVLRSQQTARLAASDLEDFGLHDSLYYEPPEEEEGHFGGRGRGDGDGGGGGGDISLPPDRGPGREY